MYVSIYLQYTYEEVNKLHEFIGMNAKNIYIWNIRVWMRTGILSEKRFLHYRIRNIHTGTEIWFLRGWVPRRNSGQRGTAEADLEQVRSLRRLVE